MHWNNGRFHGPVTLENNLKITDYKYNALNYDNNSINFGDHTINTNINGTKINIVAGSEGMTLDSAKDVYIESDTSIYTVAGTVSNFSSQDNMTLQSNKGHLSISASGENGPGNNKGLLSLNGKYGVNLNSTDGNININGNKSISICSNGNGTNDKLEIKSKYNSNFNALNEVSISSGHVIDPDQNTRSGNVLSIISYNSYIHLFGYNGLTINSAICGTSLPSNGYSGTYKDYQPNQIFFKIIS